MDPETDDGYYAAAGGTVYRHPKAWTVVAHLVPIAGWCEPRVHQEAQLAAHHIARDIVDGWREYGVLLAYDGTTGAFHGAGEWARRAPRTAVKFWLPARVGALTGPELEEIAYRAVLHGLVEAWELKKVPLPVPARVRSERTAAVLDRALAAVGAG